MLYSEHSKKGASCSTSTLACHWATLLAVDVGTGAWNIIITYFSCQQKISNDNVWFFFFSFFGGAISHWIVFFFSFNCKTGTRLDIFWKEREPSYSVFCYRETLESQITRKVLLHQMWGVKWLAHLPFPIYNTLVISQQVHSDSAPKLYLVYLAGQLHIQASHLLTVEMFLNWGLFIPGTARDCPLYTYINK